MIRLMNFRTRYIMQKTLASRCMRNRIFSNATLRGGFCFVLSLCLLLLPSGCLSLKMVLQLPKNTGPNTAGQNASKGTGRLKLEYRMNAALQNISNYPAPHDDIAPMALPLSEWDFQGIAQQSESIELVSYSVQKLPKSRGAKATEQQVMVQVELRFASEADLRLLLGPEIRWHRGEFRWQLSATEAELPDMSYPKLNGNLSATERKWLKQLFAGETLQVSVSQSGSAGKPNNRQIQKVELSMTDFLVGKKNIIIQIEK